MSTFLLPLRNLLEAYEINLLNVIFIGFTVVIVIFGSLITLVEDRLPVCIKQSFRYGKHSYKGPQDKLVTRLEVPKSWFKHFYVFSLGWSVLALVLIYRTVIFRLPAPEFVMEFLDFMAGPTRSVQTDSTRALIATVLMTMQCVRRFYETNFVQIFSGNSKINLSHYIVGYVHYFATIVALLSNTAGFVRGSEPEKVFLSKFTFREFIFILGFLYSWMGQYKANMILVALRTDAKTGEITTEKHLLPRGELFEHVSAPHMLFEVLMYLFLATIMTGHSTWEFIMIWVLSNQTTNALLTHKWYKENFKNYPKKRKAIIPFVL